MGAKNRRARARFLHPEGQNRAARGPEPPTTSGAPGLLHGRPGTAGAVLRGRPGTRPVDGVTFDRGKLHIFYIRRVKSCREGPSPDRVRGTGGAIIIGCEKQAGRERDFAPRRGQNRAARGLEPLTTSGLRVFSTEDPEHPEPCFAQYPEHDRQVPVDGFTFDRGKLHIFI